MSDHCAATRWYAFLTPGSPAVSARRSHSMALARWFSALDDIDSSALLCGLLDRLNPLPVPRFPGSRPAEIDRNHPLQGTRSDLSRSRRSLWFDVGRSDVTGSRFTSDSAPRPFHHGIRRRGGTIL